jgi:hypothetical protein
MTHLPESVSVMRFSCARARADWARRSRRLLLADRFGPTIAFTARSREHAARHSFLLHGVRHAAQRHWETCAKRDSHVPHMDRMESGM